MDFETDRGESTSKTEMQRFVDELKDSDITIENFRRYFEKISTFNETVKMQIENLKMDYAQLKERIKSLQTRESFQRAKENGIIPIEVYEMSQSLFRLTKEAYNWQTLQTSMLNQVFVKTTNLLQDVRALDIKRDALNEMREMTERQNSLYSERQDALLNLFKDVIIYKLQASEEKFMILLDQNQKSSKEVLNLLIPIIMKNNTIPDESKKRVVGELNRIDKEATPTFDLGVSNRREKEKPNRPIIPETAMPFTPKPKKEENDESISDIESDFDDFDSR